MMDESEINNLIQGCKLLKYKFHGVLAADNFPLHLPQNSFIIMNISTSQSIGTNWIHIFRRNGDYIFAYPLRQNLTSYKYLHNRIVPSAGKIKTVFELLRIGLFCIYISHYLFVETEIVKMRNVELLKIALHMMLLT